LSNTHEWQLPFDRIDRTLLSILSRKDFMVDGDVGQISLNIKADGTTCLGEKSILYKEGAPEVSASSIRVPYVSNAVFYGEVTVGIRTATYGNTVGNGLYYHVMWSASGNDNYGNIDGRMMGTKMEYFTPTGEAEPILISRNGSYVSNGEIIIF